MARLVDAFFARPKPINKGENSDRQTEIAHSASQRSAWLMLQSAMPTLLAKALIKNTETIQAAVAASATRKYPAGTLARAGPRPYQTTVGTLIKMAATKKNNGIMRTVYNGATSAAAGRALPTFA